MLVERGYFVVRFDNRDVGLSKHWDEWGAPPLIRRALALTLLAYTLGDMGADAFGLLDHLKVESANLVGVSMGGMIAQTMALDEPGRVASLCSISEL
jgi:pimeloyl-ACP methyl ester carboxylesterase